MSNVPEEVWRQWEKRTGPAVFSTVGVQGAPNAIYVTCVKKYNDATILVADNYFSKTRTNLKNGSRFSLLFITDEKKSYQFKGTVVYEEEGDRKSIMRECLDPKYPVHAVAVLTIEEAYNGANRLF